jgi:hypothetical protein
MWAPGYSSLSGKAKAHNNNNNNNNNNIIIIIIIIISGSSSSSSSSSSMALQPFVRSWPHFKSLDPIYSR